MKKQMHPDIPAAKKLTADARRSCRIAALAVLKQRALLSSPFTRDLAVGSARAFADD